MTRMKKETRTQAPLKKKNSKGSKAPIVVDYKSLAEEDVELLQGESQGESKEESKEESEEDSKVSENEATPEISGEMVPFSVGTELEQGSSDSVSIAETSVSLRDQALLLKRYLEEVSRYPLLSPEEEFDLALKLKNSGDLAAAKRMVSANLRLVVKIAMEYRNAYQNVMDLIQEGNLGLMKAVGKFDPTKGAKLSYYASWWIRSYILKYILDNFRLVKVGTTQAQKKLFFHLMREKERLEAQGLDPSPKLLADKLHVKEGEVIEMEQRLGSRGAEMSLDQPIGGGSEDDGKASFLDLLSDHGTSADQSLEEDELKRILIKKLPEFEKTLKEKEQAIFKERLMSEEPKTLQEVADKFGLTRERARQIEVQVIQKLKTFFKNDFRLEER
jgi:RNA polymerase sigma-32 factor